MVIAVKMKSKDMGKIYYYYDPLVKSNDNRYGRYTVDYFCTDGKKTVWAGYQAEKSPTAALEKVRKLVDALNEPRAFMEEVEQWWWFYISN